MIGIVNYGSGNIHAIANIYKRLNIPFILSDDHNELSKVDKLILPGVGAFDETMNMLRNSGLKTLLDDLVLEKKVPILGVCVGMQIMANGSDEGVTEGFGWIKGFVKKFDVNFFSRKPYLPHMGWNEIKALSNNPLFQEVDNSKGFYFLHSYYYTCSDLVNIISTTFYGVEFPSSINAGNIYGVQFHPEKSHTNGIQIFKNFANL